MDKRRRRKYIHPTEKGWKSSAIIFFFVCFVERQLGGCSNRNSLTLFVVPVQSWSANTCRRHHNRHPNFSVHRIRPLHASTSPTSSSSAMNPSPENNPKNRQSTALPMDTASVSKNDNKQADDEEILRLQNPQFQWRNAHWVILVDDEESIRESVGDFLYDAGYQVTACDDAPTAWKLLISYNSVNNNEEKNPQKQQQQLQRIPDCIISDIRMPEMNGIEFLGQIRQNDILKNVPVILLTAKGMTSDRIQGYKAGADVYLSKPFVPEELLSIVDNAILRKSQMMGPNGPLVELSQEMALVKQLVNQQRYETVVERTDVYLTPAQREILDLLCRGYTNQEIADARNTSKHYVTKTLQKIYSLTETKTRTQLLQWAIRNGYVPSRL